jgi:hypothetical protein
MNTLELAFGYRDAAKNIIWEKAKVSAQHPRKYYGCLSGEAWGRRELLPSLYYAKAYLGKAHGTIAFMDATGLRRWNAYYRIWGYPSPSFDDSHSGKEGQGEGSGKGMKKTAASEAQKPPKGHPYVQGFCEFQFLDGGRPVLIHKHAVLFAAPLKEEPEIAVLAGVKAGRNPLPLRIAYADFLWLHSGLR